MGNNIGNIIKSRRLELNITLDEVGKAVGVSKSTVQRWESGQITNMRRDRIDALSKSLKGLISSVPGVAVLLISIG